MKPGDTAAAILLRNALTRDELNTFMLDHAGPCRTPGSDEVEISYREPYARKAALYYVPVADIMRAVSEATSASAKGESTAKMATTSAGVAVGNKDRAMASAVIKRSYTKTAARPSSLPPFRSTMRRRASNGSVLVSVVMVSRPLVGFQKHHGKGGAA